MSDASERDPEQADERRDESSSDGTEADLAAQLDLLAEENRRLRGEYVRARRTTHRRTALGMFAVGALAVVGAVVFPDARSVLFALGGTGLFAGVLTYYLTPEQFVAAETGERVYAAFATTGARLVAELGLQDDRVYAPAETDDDEFAGVRLFVPQRGDYAVPPPEKLDSVFVVADNEFERGVALPPSGGALYREFSSAMTARVADRPSPLGDQLADALVEGFELADSATADANPDEGRLVVELSGLVYGAADRFDHPAVSFLAVGLSAELGTPVTATVRAEAGDEDNPTEASETGASAGAGESEGADALVAFEWDPAVFEAETPERA
ncbi:hypothetical protein [Halorussus lipolyticus]|uniref:hypothetical protein n=1 Tax=Halorussus lipolyticus TaxID=3034024 RepID=UPI0023E83A4A|nr:hypothetical protein [Halorussus sp. DT80]